MWKTLLSETITSFEPNNFKYIINRWCFEDATIILPHVKKVEKVELNGQKFPKLTEQDRCIDFSVRKLYGKDGSVLCQIFQLYESIDGNEVIALFSIEDDLVNLPDYYPRTSSHRFRLTRIEEKKFEIAVEVMPLKSDDLLEKEQIIFKSLLKKLIKWCKNNATGYTKRVNHDILVAKDDFEELYNQLKAKYKYWVQKWPEDTDPLKMIYEDIAIASFLICLWRQEDKKNPSFVDLGCGNGFLCYLLNNEGFCGFGVDQAKRKVWDLYENTDLREQTLFPKDMQFEVDWVIGNHADELVGWVPIIAAKSNAKFMLLPCCFYLINGKKFIHNNPRLSQYQDYLAYVEGIISECGFVIEKEHLRIPSTKNICFVGRNRRDDFNENFIDKIDRFIENSGEFFPRIPDKEKTRLWFERRNKRLSSKNKITFMPLTLDENK